MISILFGSCHWWSSKFWTNRIKACTCKEKINVDQLKFALIFVVWQILVPLWSFLFCKRNKKLVPRAFLSYITWFARAWNTPGKTPRSLKTPWKWLFPWKLLEFVEIVLEFYWRVLEYWNYSPINHFERERLNTCIKTSHVRKTH